MEFLAELHPRIVHFPIAFFILYFIFEASGIILKKNYLQKASLPILALGVLTALFSVLTGNQAQMAVNLISSADRNLNYLIGSHEDYATATLWYFSFLLFIRIYFTIRKKFEGVVTYFIIFLGLAGCILVYITGTLGGQLVFRHGIGTQLLGK